MNNYYTPAKEIEIDLVDLMWKLLMQWKAILIVCILMALIVPGIKYAKDKGEYENAPADKAAAEEQASKPVDERIESALELLPAKDRQAVMFVVHQQEMADKQQDYLDNSILMNTDPASQRTLTINYIIKSDQGISMKTLVDYYNAGLRNDDLMKDLGEVIDPDADLEYIYELVNNDYDKQVPDPEYTGSSSVIYSVSVVLPEEAEADAVTGLIDSAVNDLHNGLDAAVGAHEIQRSTVEDSHVYNKYAVDRKADILNRINSLNNNIKSAKTSLSAEQQAACEAIIAINQTADEAGSKLEAADDDELQAPGFSKKYAVLGFLLGAFLYAGIYVVRLILKKVVASASAAQSYTEARLLGEIYKVPQHKGLSALFTSKMVAKWRYKEKLDADKQIEALASTVDAVCSHHNTDRLTLLLSGLGSNFDKQIEQIVSRCSSAGNKKGIDVLNADEMDEKSLATVKNAVYAVCDRSKVDKLGSLISLVNDYDVTLLGTIYFEEL